MKTRTFLPFASGVAVIGLAIGGVFLGRALTGSGSEPTAQPAGAAVTNDEGVRDESVDAARSAEAPPPTTRVLPVLEPVRVGGSDDVVHMFDEVPLPEPGVPQVEDVSDPAPPVAGAVLISDPESTPPDSPDSDEPATDFELFSLESFNWPWLFDVFWIDPCAGATPGEPTPEGCPDGGAATISGSHQEPPLPFAHFAAGHYTEELTDGRRTCAADTQPPVEGQAAMTLFTRTPIESAALRYRLYGSTEAWTDLETVQSPADHISWWQEQFASRPYDMEWATLPICFLAPQHASMAYEIEATGTDVFGQEVRSNGAGIVSPATLETRPPATARIVGRSSVAFVDARSVEAGHVRFRTRAVDPSEENPTCEGATVAPSEDILVASNDRIVPIGVYDPAYSRKHQLKVPLPPGGRVVVCAEVYPDDNPLTPLATDRLLLVAPTQQRPRIVLQGIRRLGDETLPEGITIRAGAVDTNGRLDPCGTTYRTPVIPPGSTHRVEQALYECVTDPLPVDSMGRGQIPITLTRSFGSASSTVVEEVAVAIALDDCGPSSCNRPREWYELPIPSGDRTMCGSGFGATDCDGPDPDGIAVLRVEYPVVESDTGRYGEAILLDQIDATTATGNLRTTGWDATFEASESELRPSSRITFFTDRPVQVTLATVPVDDDGCSPVEEITTEGFATSFEIVFTAQCAGSAFLVEGTATEPDGTVHALERGRAHLVPSLKNLARVQVELLGGDGLPELGHIYRFGVRLDGQVPTAHWYDWTTSRRGTSDSCMGLSGSTARSRGAVPETYLIGAELEVYVMIHVTTTGSGDCSGDGRTGLGEIEMTGSFTFEQLQSGEPLVLESPPDAPLRMRLTLTTDRDQWRP